MSHPTDEELQAFDAGRLDDEALARMEAHLAECTGGCHDRLDALAPCTALRLLKDAASVAPAGPRRSSEAELRDQLIGRIIEAVGGLDRYEGLGFLRGGGMAVLLRATIRGTGEEVALKVFDEDYLLFVQGSADHAVPCRRRFRREYEVGARLGRVEHPHIVGVRGLASIGGRDVIEMELIRGISLGEYLADRARPVMEETALAWAGMIASAMVHYESLGVVHRDIKPENCLVDPDRHRKALWLIDFGLAKVSGDDAEHTRLTVAGHSFGTPRYVSTEQQTHPADVDARADQFSLGMTLAWALSKPGEWEHYREGLPEPTLRRASPPMAALLRKLTNPRREQRFATARELAEALPEIAEQIRTQSDAGRRGTTRRRVLPILCGLAATPVAVALGAKFWPGVRSRVRSEEDVVPPPAEPEPGPWTRPIALQVDADDLTVEVELASAGPDAEIDLAIRVDDRGEGVVTRVRSLVKDWNQVVLGIPGQASASKPFNQRGAQSLGTSWHRLRVVVAGENLDCYLDDHRLIAAGGLPVRRGGVALAFSGAGFRIRWIEARAPDGSGARWSPPSLHPRVELLDTRGRLKSL